MERFNVTSERLAVFLAALTLGMLAPTRLAFAQRTSTCSRPGPLILLPGSRGWA